ncbi:MAG TPA: lasso peptide biosynthesis B2 protein [Candidatus Acidoferrum sp.]
MWARLRRFSALPRPAKGLFLRVVALLPFLTIYLRICGFRSTHRILQKFIGPPKKTLSEAEAQSRTALTSRMILAAARNSPIPSTCLERSLALWWLLIRQGVATQFRIGVRKDGEKFAAHAWVERNGVALGEPEASHLHYRAFAEELSGDIS